MRGRGARDGRTAVQARGAVWIGMLGLDFQVTEPPELVEHVRVLAARYAGALPAGRGSARVGPEPVPG